MKKHAVLFLPSAKNDINEARSWYAQFNKELPLRFKEELRQIVIALKSRPEVHATRYKNVRFALLEKFPYAVHYFIDESSLTVKIGRAHV